jgi:hypothetical protein
VVIVLGLANLIADGFSMEVHSQIDVCVDLRTIDDQRCRLLATVLPSGIATHRH